MTQPTCGLCARGMTPENSTVMPEMFLCDRCAAETVPDETIRRLKNGLVTEADALEQMTMAANQIHAELAAAEKVIAAARESCTSTLVFLGGEPTEDDHWRASQSADALRKALKAFDAASLAGRAAAEGSADETGESKSGAGSQNVGDERQSRAEGAQ